MCKKIIVLLMVMVMSLSVLAGCVEDDKSDAGSATFAAVTTVAEAQTNLQTDAAIETQTVENEVTTAQMQTEAPAVDENYIYSDTDAMTAIEQADLFEVHISGYRFEKNITNSALSGKDGLIVTVKNNTGNVINDIDMFVYCTGADGKGVTFSGLSSVNNLLFDQDSSELRYSNKVKLMGTQTAGIAEYSEKELAIKCDSSKIETVNVIVYSYVDAQGNKIVNENCYEWLAKSFEGTELYSSLY